MTKIVKYNEADSSWISSPKSAYTSYLFDFGKVKILRKFDESLVFHIHKLHSDRVINCSVASGAAFLLDTPNENNEKVRALKLSDNDRILKIMSLSFIISKLHKLALGSQDWGDDDMNNSDSYAVWVDKFEEIIRDSLKDSVTLGGYIDKLKIVLEQIKKDIKFSRFDL